MSSFNFDIDRIIAAGFDTSITSLITGAANTNYPHTAAVSLDP